MERHVEIAQVAFERWVQRGCPPGSAEADWLEAERQSGSSTEHQSGRREGAEPDSAESALAPAVRV